MPVKRRLSKARMKPAQEAEFWASYFDHGDFLLAGWERELGLPWVPPGDREGWAARAPQLDALGRDAWARLGRLYLDGQRGLRAGRWALGEFGEPETCQ